MKNKKIILFIVATFFLASFFVLQRTFAADQTNISISPLIFELSANPGDSVTNEFIVRNSGKDPAVISIESRDFVAEGEEGEVTVTEEKTSYSLASWIQSEDGNFTLQGGQQKRVKFIVRVPYNAEPGGHYASIYAHLSPTIDGATSGSGIAQKIGSLILLKVAGAVNEKATVESFTPSKREINKGIVNFDVRIKNTGTTHIKPKGMIAVTNIWGKKVADVTVEQKNVLPGAIRHMTAQWKDGVKFGKYTATLFSYYGTNNEQLTASTTFWVVPWKQFAIWGGGILIVVLLIWFGRKRLKLAAKAFFNKK